MLASGAPPRPPPDVTPALPPCALPAEPDVPEEFPDPPAPAETLPEAPVAADGLPPPPAEVLLELPLDPLGPAVSLAVEPSHASSIVDAAIGKRRRRLAWTMRLSRGDRAKIGASRHGLNVRQGRSKSPKATRRRVVPGHGNEERLVLGPARSHRAGTVRCSRSPAAAHKPCAPLGRLQLRAHLHFDRRTLAGLAHLRRQFGSRQSLDSTRIVFADDSWPCYSVGKTLP